MRAEKVVAALLQAAAPVTAIVGTKVYGGVAPESTAAPLIVYRKAGAQRVPSVSMGALCEVEASIEVLIVARTYAELKSLGEEVRKALAYQSGAIAGVDVMQINADSEGADDYDSDLREHGQAWTFSVKHSE